MRRRGRGDADQPAEAPDGSSSQLRAFINYRREDASGHAGRLYDSLTAAMGEENVFMDIDAIPAGEDFPTVIDRALHSCDVLLALVGTRWLTVADNDGRPRLEDSGDFVRLEIEAGLERDDVVVIPVLVQEAQMPRASEVPQSMAALTRRNAFQLSDNRWRSDVERLILAIRRVAEEKKAREARAKADREATARAEREAQERAEQADEKVTVGTSAHPAARSRGMYWFALPVLILAAVVVVYAADHGSSPASRNRGSPPPSGASTQSPRPPHKLHGLLQPTNAAIDKLANSPNYENPLITVNAPDPSLIRAHGLYFAYTTQTDGRAIHLPMMVSNDLIAWRYLGDALPTLPKWADQTKYGDTWGPHAIRINNMYYLYFSERLKSKGMGIALATSKNPQGPWHVTGPPLIHGLGYRVIGPFVLREPNGRLLLYWGSDFQPIQVRPLSADGTSLVGTPRVVLSPTTTATSYDDLIEGADVVPHGRFYYLFYSGDRCCGAEAHYAELVARSSSPTGLFTRDPHNPVIQANHAFNAPGHGFVFRDKAGAYFILYHAMDRSSPTPDLRYLMLDRIQWQGGWPVVNDGHGPSSTPQPRPKVGT